MIDVIRKNCLPTMGGHIKNNNNVYLVFKFVFCSIFPDKIVCTREENYK